MLDYKLQIEEWDQWIRSGQASKVRHLAFKLNHKKIPRALLVEYAHVARRVGAPELIVLWLSPIVRSEKMLSLPATTQEKAIYGLGLLRLGAFREASQILSEVAPEEDPQIYFYRASLSINQWNYARAVPDLKKYIKNPQVSPYSRLVGRLNLCAALVTHPDANKTERYFTDLMKELKKQSLPLLIGNLLEIRAQWFYNQNRFGEASEDLNAAAKLLEKADSRSLLYIQKWRAILELRLSKGPVEIKKNLSALAEIKNQAVQLKNWETLRDCDLHEGFITHNQGLIKKVYWGTKSIAYKKRVREVFPSLPLQKEFLWNHGGAELPVIDLVNEAPTRLLQRLFFVLSREMYQPLRSTEIIDSIYPDEYYNPKTSPVKLQRLIARAREWLVEKDFPVSISAYRNAYQLTFRSACQLRLKDSVDEFNKRPLPVVSQSDFFKVDDWAKELHLTPRAARRQISQLVTQGKLEKIGHGSRTKYRTRKKVA